jgi:hypothetical protein
MNRRDVIRILVVLAVILWLSLVVIPRRHVLVDNLSASYYDKQMTSKEYMIHKKLDALDKNKGVPEELKLDLQEMLAKNLWASFRAQDAASLLRDVEAKREKLNKNYNQKSINTMLTLAGIYRDLNQLDESAFWYRKVGQLDLANLPADDGRLVRDETNFAMLDYLRGDIEKDEVKREQCFKDSIAHIEQAMKVWHKQKDPDTAALANLFYLQYLSYRGMGNIFASRQAFGEMKYLNKSLKRTYNLPWK